MTIAGGFPLAGFTFSAVAETRCSARWDTWAESWEDRFSFTRYCWAFLCWAKATNARLDGYGTPLGSASAWWAGSFSATGCGRRGSPDPAWRSRSSERQRAVAARSFARNAPWIESSDVALW